MFEKEAEEWAKENMDCVKTENCLNQDCNYFSDEERIIAKSAFEEGAALGYNKANEWHKVADGDLPKENKLYLVQIKDNGLAIAYFNGRHWETRYNLGESGHCVETVIAWREIPTFEE